MTDWNDDRGFGFITPDSGGPRVFAHISAFPRGRRPAADDLVTFDAGRDERGRPRASGVAYAGPTRATSRATPGLRLALAVAGSFLGLLVGLVALDRAPALLLVPYGLLSLVAFTMYRADKVAAQRAAWRIPEANLHAVALLGGWPGALVARRVFRHKTRKQPFRTIFWGTVAANCAALGWLVHDNPLRLG